jgi:hypothetical protein
MTTATEPLELLEGTFGQLNTRQRAFILARLESSTDAEAARIAGVSAESARRWRSAEPYASVYQVILAAKPEQLARIGEARMEHLVGHSAQVLKDFLGWQPSRADLDSGNAAFETGRARLALDTIKAVGPKRIPGPDSAIPADAQARKVGELTRASMVDNTKAEFAHAEP